MTVEPPKCDKKKYQSKEFCGLLKDKSGPFSACLSKMKSEEIDSTYDLCEFDMCHDKKDKVDNHHHRVKV